MCEDTDRSSPVLSWKTPEVPGRIWRRIFRVPWRFTPNPSHAPINLTHQAAGWELSVPSVFSDTNWGCLFPISLGTEWKGRSACEFKSWISGLSMICIGLSCLEHEKCSVKEKVDSLFQLPKPWFHLDPVSLTKNLSKAKNFKNHCYEWFKNLHTKEVPKWSVLIADFLLSWISWFRNGSVFTHTQKDLLFSQVCVNFVEFF